MMNIGVYILCGIIVLQELLHRSERRDLYNRIMSRDLTEFKGETRKPFSKHKRIVEQWNGSDDCRSEKGIGKSEEVRNKHFAFELN